MNGLRVAAVALIVAGVLAVAYGRFYWMRETQTARIGPIRMAVIERRTVNVPVWAGLVGIAAGVGLLLWGGTRR